MPRSHKPRKRYIPKRVDIDPVQMTIATASLLLPSQRHDLGDPMKRALEALRTGTGGWRAWSEMADAMNVAEQLALRGICSDRMPEIQAAQTALHDLYHRHAQRDSWTLRGTELQALDTGVFFAQLQLEYATQGEFRDSILAVQRRVSAALAGNAPRDALVCVGALGLPGNTPLAAAAPAPVVTTH